jgi:hypothetical protein
MNGSFTFLKFPQQSTLLNDVAKVVMIIIPKANQPALFRVSPTLSQSYHY